MKTCTSVCPYDCPDACGLVVTVDGGRVVSVAGDKSHPFTRGTLCPKMAHYERTVHSPRRLTTPLKRIGPKGSGQFAPISWDQALAEIAGTWKAIIAEAEEIKDSTAWVETSRKFNELMDRWKKAGRAGRRDDDALWARFRAAADTFFNARQADREQISSSEKENLAKKEELLTKAEALVPVKDEKAAKQARQALAAIQEEWDQIGYVPRDDMHRIESRLDAVDKQIKAVEDAAWKQSDPEADARKSSFEEQLNAQLAELNAQIAAESDPKKKAKLEAEKATKEQWLNAIK